jgi:hypothetical protein
MKLMKISRVVKIWFKFAKKNYAYMMDRATACTGQAY